MGKGNYQKIGCGVHGGGNGCGCGKPKLSMTPEEINALLDKLEEILNNGGQPSPAPSPIVPAGVELTENKVLQVRPYVAEEQSEDTAENDKYPSERAVARSLYLIDQYLHQVEQDGSELAGKVGSLEYFEERYILPEEVLPLSSFSVGGIMEALYKLIKKNAIAIANIGEQIAGLQQQTAQMQQQINVLAAQITGITINVSPQSLTVGETTDVVISINTTSEADSVKIYRNGTEIYRDAVSGTEWEYTDEFTPDAAGEVTYKAVVVIGSMTKENEVSVAVQKQATNIQWSAHTAEATIGAQNTFPELRNVTGGMDIAYRSSNENVADIDANGEVTLIGAGNTTITASFAGDATREGSQDSYGLLVVGDELVSITWAGGSISPSTVPVGGTATLTKGTVTANYASGRTEDVTNSAEFVTNGNGYIEGTTYHPRSTAGPEDIFPRYGGKSATNPIMVMVTEQRLNVVIGHGRSYSGAMFEDLESSVQDNLDFSISLDSEDYIFLKVDKRDEVRNLYLLNENGGDYEWFEISLDIPQDDGDYKYYQTDMQFNAYNDVSFRINKT